MVRRRLIQLLRGPLLGRVTRTESAVFIPMVALNHYSLIIAVTGLITPSQIRSAFELLMLVSP